MRIHPFVLRSATERFDFFWRALGCTTGSVLLFAAVMKLAAGRQPTQRDWGGPMMFLPAGEIAIAAWLLFGFRGGRTWFTTVVVLCVLLAASLYKLLAGERSCGCFGQIETKPYVTVILDTALLSGTILCRAAAARAPRAYSHGRVRVIAVALCTSIGIMLARWPRQVVRDDTGGGSDLFILDADSWPGRPLSLLSDVDIGGRLHRGRWLVVFYRWDCSHCRTAIPRYEAFAAQPGGLPVALIELPPYARHADPARQPVEHVLKGRLDESRNWFAQTPVAALLDDGRVTRAAQGEHAESPAFALGGSSALH